MTPSACAADWVGLLSWSRSPLRACAAFFPAEWISQPRKLAGPVGGRTTNFWATLLFVLLVLPRLPCRLPGLSLPNCCLSLLAKLTVEVSWNAGRLHQSAASQVWRCTAACLSRRTKLSILQKFPWPSGTLLRRPSRLFPAKDRQRATTCSLQVAGAVPCGPQEVPQTGPTARSFALGKAFRVQETRSVTVAAWLDWGPQWDWIGPGTSG